MVGLFKLIKSPQTDLLASLGGDDMLPILHPQMLSALAQLPTGVPLVLVMRHSLREQPDNHFASYQVPLTPQGLLLAEQFAHQLPWRVTAFYSSPVQRCVDTAQAMADAMGNTGKIQTVNCLVEPGSYVQKAALIKQLFVNLGPLGFLNHHLQHDLSGMLSIREGTANLLDHLRANLGGADELAVHVTHDTLLAAFISGLLDLQALDEADWPWMMEGVFLWFSDKGVEGIWRGQHFVTHYFEE